MGPPRPRRPGRPVPGSGSRRGSSSRRRPRIRKTRCSRRLPRGERGHRSSVGPWNIDRAVRTTRIEIRRVVAGAAGEEGDASEGRGDRRHRSPAQNPALSRARCGAHAAQHATRRPGSYTRTRLLAHASAKGGLALAYKANEVGRDLATCAARCAPRSIRSPMRSKRAARTTKRSGRRNRRDSPRLTCRSISSASRRSSSRETRRRARNGPSSTKRSTN